MITYFNDIGSGICADVTYAGDKGYLLVQDIHRRQILLYSWGLGAVPTLKREDDLFPPVSVRGASYPRFIAKLTLAYRSTEGIGYLQEGTHLRALGPCGGIFPFAGRSVPEYFAYRSSGGTTIVEQNGVVVHTEHRQTSQGLADISISGVPIYRQDTRTQEQPYGTYPDYSVDLVVTEGPSSGALVRDKMSETSLLLWEGADAETPAIAVSGTQIAVCTVKPLRLAVFDRSDLRDTLPPPVVPNLENRPIWCGLYKTQSQGGPGGSTYDPWMDLPGNCEPDLEPRQPLGQRAVFMTTENLVKAPNLIPRCAGIYCEAQGDPWTVAIGLHNQHVEAKRAFPQKYTFGVVDANFTDPLPKDPRLPDVIVYEAYLRGNDSVQTMIARLSDLVKRDRHEVVGIVPQMYTGPGYATPEEIRQIVTECAWIAKRQPKVRVLWGFAANRANGLRDPDVAAAALPPWARILQTVTTPPILERK